MMEIIPVIDLMAGQVVHARYGKRQHYQPIQSLLCIGSKPNDIIHALLELYPFKTLYIADIDAIQESDNQFDSLVALTESFPEVAFWLDCGIRQMNHRALHYQKNIRPVIGSENTDNLISYKAVSYACNSRHILSLDFKDDQFLGANELYSSSKYWPDDTICMSLKNVGSEQGFDLDTLNSIMQLNLARKSPSRLYAAGGVRNIEDCNNLQRLGINGALVATALHQKKITYSELKNFLET